MTTRKATVAPSADPLLLACRSLGEAMDRFDDVACRALGVGRSDLRALNLLEFGPLAPGEIGNRLGLTSGSVTILLDRLEGAGYVVRKHRADDRRKVSVSLRPRTYRAFARVYAPLGLAAQRATIHVPALSRDATREVMDLLRTAFDERSADLTQPSPGRSRRAYRPAPSVDRHE